MFCLFKRVLFCACVLHSVCLRVRVVGVIVRLSFSLSPFARKRPKLEEVPPGRTGNETLAASTPDLPEHWCQVPVVLSLLSCLSVGRSNVGAVSLSVWLVWTHPCVLCSCGCALCVLLFLFYFSMHREAMTMTMHREAMTVTKRQGVKAM